MPLSLQSKRILLAIVLLQLLSCIGLAKDWRGIVPLHSTRDDVEKLLGPSRFGGGWAYEFGEERVFFHYQSDKDLCGREFGMWDVPLATVTSISVYPRPFLLLADLNLDLTRFVRLKSCSPGGYTYADRVDGLSYSGGDGMIGSIGHGPALNSSSPPVPI